jgi:ATP-dependent Zn protease
MKNSSVASTAIAKQIQKQIAKEIKEQIDKQIEEQQKILKARQTAARIAQEMLDSGVLLSK